jgi:hypothetical protein
MLCGFAQQLAARTLFNSQQLLEVEIKGSFATLLKDKELREQQIFELRANDKVHKVKLRVRGKSRTDVCDFPPLRVNFSKTSTKGTVFSGQDKIKLVTKCAKSSRNDVDTIMEYSAYRIFNILTDVSYRARLVKLQLNDEHGSLVPSLQTQYGIFLESDEELADRLQLKASSLTGVSMQRLSAQHMATVYLFQYLIGNTDWSLVSSQTKEMCCHNGDIFAAGKELFYVPYDFDLSGLVNARYAVTDSSLGIKKVTERRYRGFCTDRSYLKIALSQLKSKQTQIVQLIEGLPGISEKRLKRKVAFLNKFFEAAKDQERMVRRFEKSCL